MYLRGTKRRPGLRGFYGQARPKFPFGLGCACKPLGDDDSIPFSPTGLPYDGTSTRMPSSPTPGVISTIDQEFLNLQSQGPTVSGATLLAAAARSDAPVLVQQAAAAYKSAHPFAAIFDGTTAGIPNSLLIGGAGLLLLIPLLKKK